MTKHIHIVEPYHSVAMQHMSVPFQALETMYEVTTGEVIDPSADVNIHCPWHTMTGAERGTSKHIILYTHVNHGAEVGLLGSCERADIVTAMSYEGRRELVKFGVDPKKIWVVYAGAEQFNYRKRLISIVGYPQPNGRKREHLLLDLAWQYDLSRYEFLFTGSGWEDIVSKLVSLGVSAGAFHADTQETLNLVYQRSDALLVTGYIEGGPLPVLEAMASGTKVFSPRFGYAADLLDDADLYDGPDELIEKMDNYFSYSVTNHYLARAWTWNDYVTEYALLIGRLLGESVDLYPKQGASRYAQLLDVIDEYRPQKIVEIGTWKGNTALRMIQQAAKYHRINEVMYQGFDLFEGMTPADFRAELSKNGWIQEVVQKRLNATGAGVMLVKGYTRETIGNLLPADFYFIDGGHSEETIENDAAAVLEKLTDDNVIVFDDYYHANKPEGMGCNRVIDNLDRMLYEITHLPVHTLAEDGREIGMVKVRKANDGDISLQRWQTSTGSYLDFRAGDVGTSYTLHTPALSPADAPSTASCSG